MSRVFPVTQSLRHPTENDFNVPILCVAPASGAPPDPQPGLAVEGAFALPTTDGQWRRQ